MLCQSSRQPHATQSDSRVLSCLLNWILFARGIADDLCGRLQIGKNSQPHKSWHECPVNRVACVHSRQE